MCALPVSPATGTGKVRELRAGAMLYSIGATRNSAFVHGWVGVLCVLNSGQPVQAVARLSCHTQKDSRCAD